MLSLTNTQQTLRVYGCVWRCTFGASTFASLLFESRLPCQDLLVSKSFLLYRYEHATMLSHYGCVWRYAFGESTFASLLFESRLPCQEVYQIRLLFFIIFYEHATNTFVFTVASDAALSVQAPSLRYYSNRVSPAKTYL